MIRSLSLDEDLELKRFATTPKDQKPRFNWRDVLLDDPLVEPEIKVEVAGRERDFDLAEVADTIGNALTDLLRLSNTSSISESNSSNTASVFADCWVAPSSALAYTVARYC